MEEETKQMLEAIGIKNKEINIRFFEIMSIGIGIFVITILALILSIQRMSVVGISLSSIGIFICGKTLIKVVLGFIQAKQVLKIMKQSLVQIDE